MPYYRFALWIGKEWGRVASYFAACVVFFWMIVMVWAQIAQTRQFRADITDAVRAMQKDLAEAKEDQRTYQREEFGRLAVAIVAEAERTRAAHESDERPVGDLLRRIANRVGITDADIQAILKAAANPPDPAPARD